MKSVEINGDIDSRKEFLMDLFRASRNTAEGHKQFLIEKIKTKHTTYEVNETQHIKLPEDVFNQVLTSIKDFELIEFYIVIDEENIKIAIHEDVLSVSTVKKEELEDEIVKKIELKIKRIS